MYDNEIYPNYNTNTGSPVTGNFSGAQEPQTPKPEQPRMETWQAEQPRTEQAVEQSQVWQSVEQPQQKVEQPRTEQPAYRTYQTYQTAQQPVQAPTVSEKKRDKKPGFFPKLLVSVSLGLLFGIFAGIGFYAVQQGINATQKEQVQESPVYKEQSKIPEKGIAQNDADAVQPVGSQVVYSVESDVSDIVDQVMPAMVSIINNYTQKSYFWGRTYEEELAASGSGIIVGQTDDELLIVSNNHVVADTVKLMVTFIDGTEAEARIKGVDSDMDIAVISINLKDLSKETKDAIVVATLGDSDTLRMGQRVIAIGNALGYGQSTTVGYISALNREIELDDGSTKSFIQTDAAINPGNSGGALLNMAGEVIGINSNKIGGSSIEGMGYAIPITTASPIIADLMERQTRSKVSSSQAGYIGIEYEEVTDQISQMFGMPKGVYVKSVLENTGAEAAGMLPGDVIVNFDGSKISSFADLQAVLQYYAVGDTAQVTVMRAENGEYSEYVLTVTLGKRPVEN